MQYPTFRDVGLIALHITEYPFALPERRDSDRQQRQLNVPFEVGAVVFYIAYPKR